VTDESGGPRRRISGLRGFQSEGPSPWTDLDRPPLDALGLRHALVVPGGLWTSVDVVAETGSTNTDLAARARAGAAEGAVLVAELQNAGRGRLERRWSAPARSGLFFSLLLRPGPTVPAARYGWLPLLMGVVAAGTLSRTAEVPVGLKWPNDLLVTVGGAERKLGGILTELVGDALVPGIGINVSLRKDELPVPAAGSLALAGAAVTDRDTLLRVLLREFAEVYEEWRQADGDPLASGLLAAYTARCTTIGRTVRVQLPGGRELVGEAAAVDGDGRLVVRTADGAEHPVGAGDVLHVRPGPQHG
jgi:BirA family transcriptional regulator, biotin operon repressor / biotin---[acetyl-CoA-carboxylase] ligase